MRPGKQFEKLDSILPTQILTKYLNRISFLTMGNCIKRQSTRTQIDNIEMMITENRVQMNFIMRELHILKSSQRLEQNRRYTFCEQYI